MVIGSEAESIPAWQARCNIKSDSHIRLVKLAHMRYQHPDLEEITTFLEGMLL